MPPRREWSRPRGVAGRPGHVVGQSLPAAPAFARSWAAVWMYSTDCARKFLE